MKTETGSKEAALRQAREQQAKEKSKENTVARKKAATATIEATDTATTHDNGTETTAIETTTPAVEVLDTTVMNEAEARAALAIVRRKTDEIWAELKAFHARKGWLALGYKSFSECAAEELGYTRQHAYRLIDAASVAEQLTEAGVETTGMTESHARELKRLPEPARAEVAREVKFADVQAKDVRAAVDTKLGVAPIATPTPPAPAPTPTETMSDEEREQRRAAAEAAEVERAERRAAAETARLEATATAQAEAEAQAADLSARWGRYQPQIATFISGLGDDFGVLMLDLARATADWGWEIPGVPEWALYLAEIMAVESGE